MTKKTFKEFKPKVVLGVAAHMDDLDFGAAGTVAKLAADGAEVYYLILTDGGKGTADRSVSPADLTKTRQKEQQEALKILGGKEAFFLNYADGALENTLAVKRDIVRVIRRLKPDMIITMDPSMLYSAERGFINHPDHRAAGQATLDAVWPLARDHLSFPELVEQGFEPHNTSTVLLINLNESNFAVDISDVFTKKIDALGAHRSQTLSSLEHIERVTKIAEDVGKENGYHLAESFIRIDVGS